MTHLSDSMKCLLISWFFIFLPVFTSAQSQEELFTELNNRYTQRQFKEAIPLAEKLIGITSKKGDNHPDHKESLRSLIMLYFEIGDYDKAAPVCSKLAEIYRSYYGATNAEYIQTLTILGTIYEKQGDIEKAKSLYKKIADTHSRQNGEHTLEYVNDIDRLAGLYALSKEFDKAESLYLKSLELKKTLLGEKHLSYGKTLIWLGKLYETMQKYSQAEPVYIASAALAKIQFLGESSKEYSVCLATLAAMYIRTGQYNKAKTQYLLLKTLDKKFSKEDDPNYATNLHNLAEVYEKLGDYANADSVLTRSLALRKRYLGEDHIDYAASLNALGLLYGAMNLYQKAEPLLIQANKIAMKILGVDHSDVATIQENLGTLYLNMGEKQKAESLYLQAQVTRKKFYGENKTAYATGLNNLGELYKSTGQYDKAELLYIQSVEILKKTLGENHPDYASSLNNLGSLYQEMGEYSKAESLISEAKEIRMSALGKAHPNYLMSLNNLGLLYLDMSRYDKAEPLLQEATESTLTTLGKGNAYAACMNNMALLFTSLGQYAKAEPIRIQTIDIIKKSLGESHPAYAKSLANLSALYVMMGKLEDAEPLQVKAMAIIKKTLGETHPSYAVSLNNLGLLYLNMGHYEKSSNYLSQAKDISMKTLGENHPEYATSLNNLAFLYSALGQHTKAELLYIQANEIVKRVMGNTNKDYSQGLENLGLLYQKMGQYAKAETCILQNNDIELKNLVQNFTILSEQEKGNYLSNKISLLQANNSYLYNNKKASFRILQNNFDQQMLFKSLTLADTKNMLLSVRQSKDTAVQSALKNWQAGKRILAKQYSMPIDTRRADLKQVEARTENLEKELSRNSAEFRKQQSAVRVSVKNIQENMMEDEVAIEFVSFHLYNKKWTDSTIYAAYILRSTDSVPVFIPLCEEKQLSGIFSAKGVSKESIKALYRSDIAGEPEQKKMELGDSLYNLIWKPLLPHLKGIKKINFSPAGLLHKVAFYALPTGDSQLLLDKYELYQYTSLRQLADDSVESNKAAGIAIFGNCAFTMDKNLNATKNPRKKLSNIIPSVNETRRGSWIDLPGTAEEIKSIQELFGKNKITTNSYSQQNASEENLKSLSGNSPAILHLATHGFFLADPQKKKTEGYRVGSALNLAEDPLLRSGIVLSGANYAWSGGLPVEGKEDGIVTAYEISQLDLRQTELVVLSACETALGDIKGNEGVFGLQRAFKLAGVKNMILSLWRVPDAETAELMAAFYRYYISGKPARDAFAAAQKDMRIKYKPYYWAAFVLIE